MIFYLKTLTALISTLALAAVAVGTIVLSATEADDRQAPVARRHTPSLAAQSSTDCTAGACRAN